MAFYAREVDAEQFLVDKLPWPAPVKKATYPEYVVRVSEHSHAPIEDGDWVAWPVDSLKVVGMGHYRYGADGEPVYPRILRKDYFEKTYYKVGREE